MTRSSEGSDGESIEKLLRFLEGEKIPYIQSTEDAKNPYCDVCSQPINPNTRVQLYATNKLITGHKPDSGIRIISLHCPDCRFRFFYYPCVGYLEIFLDATVNTDWEMTDIDITQSSTPDDGIEWEPTEVLEKLFGIPYQKLLSISGYQSQGPQDVIDILISLDIDPRNVISEDGTVTMPQSAQDKLVEKGGEIVEKHEKGNSPPPVDLMDNLEAWARTTKES